MLTRGPLLEMLKMQGEMNAKVNPEWLDAGYPFLRAVLMEGSEAIEHHGWKWWKAQTCDMGQLQMELVDIWHFALSATIASYNGDIEAAADEILDNAASRVSFVSFDHGLYYPDTMDVPSKLELLIGLAAARRFDGRLFGLLLVDVGMDWGDLYRQYVGKNVLNFFRQDNGYKTGAYVKVWDRREDNEHLTEILDAMDPLNPNLREEVYAALATRYAARSRDDVFLVG